MAEFGDFIYKITPLLVAVLGLFVVPASIKFQKKKESKDDGIEITQGKLVEFDELDYLKNDIIQERTIGRLRLRVEYLQGILDRHGIEYRKEESEKEESR